jgi:hypothetical protein
LLIAVVVPCALLAGFTVACSKNKAGSADDTRILTAADCPTDNTKSFPKARFVANIGLSAGTFHRWIYKPFQEGKFKSGADGRVMALAKAAAAGLFIKHELSNAVDNVKADPNLCKAMIGPLSELRKAVDGIKDKVSGGDLAALTSMDGLIGGLMSTAKSNGLDVQEQVQENP